MKLEYLNDISEQGAFPGLDVNQLIRLYDFDTLQACKIRDLIQESIIQNNESIFLNNLDFVETLNCKLILRIADEDLGIVTTNHKNFFCDLTIDGYRNMIQLMEPFCKGNSKGYAFLYDVDNEMEFLFAPLGQEW